MAAPLPDILRQKGSFTFGIEQERAFQKLKDALTQAAQLIIFDPALPGRVLADTLGFDSGAILKQLVDGHQHPIEYFSKRLSDVESRCKGLAFSHPQHDVIYTVLVYIVVEVWGSCRKLLTLW